MDQKTKPWWIDPMVIVQQTTHRAYILVEIDGAISKLCFPTFCVISYHALSKTDIDLQTFFVFPDANEQMEDEEDEMRISRIKQDQKRNYHLTIMKTIYSTDRLPMQYRLHRCIPKNPKTYTISSI
jgi:hypothetical protein